MKIGFYFNLFIFCLFAFGSGNIKCAVLFVWLLRLCVLLLCLCVCCPSKLPCLSLFNLSAGIYRNDTPGQRPTDRHLPTGLLKIKDYVLFTFIEGKGYIAVVLFCSFWTWQLANGAQIDQSDFHPREIDRQRLENQLFTVCLISNLWIWSLVFNCFTEILKYSQKQHRMRRMNRFPTEETLLGCYHAQASVPINEWQVVVFYV